MTVYCEAGPSVGGSGTKSKAGSPLCLTKSRVETRTRILLTWRTRSIAMDGETNSPLQIPASSHGGKRLIAQRQSGYSFVDGVNGDVVVA